MAQMNEEMESLKLLAQQETENTERMTRLYRQTKRELQEREDDLNRECSKSKDMRRKCDDLEERLEVLQKENQTLKVCEKSTGSAYCLFKGRINTERRVSMMSTVTRMRYGSTNSINKADDSVIIEEVIRPGSRTNGSQYGGQSEEDKESVRGDAFRS